MKHTFLISLLLAANCYALRAQEMSQASLLKSPGNPAKRLALVDKGGRALEAAEAMPVEVKQTVVKQGETTIVNVLITAKERTYFNFEKTFKIKDYIHK